jgi:hypothetical protein
VSSLLRDQFPSVPAAHDEPPGGVPGLHPRQLGSVPDLHQAMLKCVSRAHDGLLGRRCLGHGLVIGDVLISQLGMLLAMLGAKGLVRRQVLTRHLLVVLDVPVFDLCVLRDVSLASFDAGRGFVLCHDHHLVSAGSYDVTPYRHDRGGKSADHRTDSHQPQERVSISRIV